MNNRNTRRVALYLRVSTSNGQTVENQRRELMTVAKRAGWQVVAEYADEGISGAKGRDRRPQFDAMLRAATRREFDMLAVWSVDRLGRSLQDLVAMLGELRAAGVGLYLHQQALDTSTPAGEAMFNMLGVFAQFERAMIRERVSAGLARARAAGRIGGRPRLAETKRAAVRAALAGGASVRQAAILAQVSVGTAHGVARQGR
jgi:DNA invertase Pin-like site-specific DNA recombinase